MATPKKSLSGAAGEHLALGEILKRGREAYLAHGMTQKGWDIAVVNPCGEPLRVQVKSLAWPDYGAVNGKFDEGFDVLVVVLLNRSSSSRFLVIPHSDLQSRLSAPNPDSKRGAGTRTLTVGKSFETDEKKQLAQFENAWSNVIDVTAPSKDLTL